MDPHPKLYAGFNSDDHNGDEYDGPGTNWARWPKLFDTFEPKQPIVIDSDMMSVFDGCPDLVVPCQDNTIVFPQEVREQTLKKAG